MRANKLGAATLSLPLFFACAGCAPHGWLHTPQGDERLQSALHVNSVDGIGRTNGILIILANSELPCSLPSVNDPDAITEADQAYYFALYREGARIVVLYLYNWESDWTGSYPVIENPDENALDVVEPRAAGAIYHAVLEAAVTEDDGLYREYEVLQEQYEEVGEPGSVNLDVVEDSLEGSFSLDSIDVSGSFRTEHCGDATDIMRYISSLEQALTQPTEDDEEDKEGDAGIVTQGEADQ